MRVGDRLAGGLQIEFPGVDKVAPKSLRGAGHGRKFFVAFTKKRHPLFEFAGGIFFFVVRIDQHR